MSGWLRRYDGFATMAVLAALVAVGFALRPAPLSGRVRVVDGDTLVLDAHRVRLAGIDAPELAQTCRRGDESYRCGEVASDALRALTRDAAVTCRLSGRDRYGRDLGRCSAGPADLGATMVRRGLAVAYGDYLHEEAEARALGAGLWAGPFERPDEWRRRHEREAERR